MRGARPCRCSARRAPRVRASGTGSCSELDESPELRISSESVEACERGGVSDSSTTPLGGGERRDPTGERGWLPTELALRVTSTSRLSESRGLTRSC